MNEADHRRQDIYFVIKSMQTAVNIIVIYDGGGGGSVHGVR